MLLKKMNKKVILPFFVLLFLLILDGMVSAQFHALLTLGPAEMMVRGLFIGLFYFAFRLPLKVNLTYALIFGFLVDSYYSGILGIYFTAFAITVYIAYLLKDRWELNILSIGVLGIFIYFAFELIVYLFYTWIDFVTFDFIQFFIYAFVPSLLLNMVLYFILFPILKWALDVSGVEGLQTLSEN